MASTVRPDRTYLYACSVKAMSSRRRRGVVTLLSCHGGVLWGVSSTLRVGISGGPGCRGFGNGDGAGTGWPPGAGNGGSARALPTAGRGLAGDWGPAGHASRAVISGRNRAYLFLPDRVYQGRPKHAPHTYLEPQWSTYCDCCLAAVLAGQYHPVAGGTGEAPRALTFTRESLGNDATYKPPRNVQHRPCLLCPSIRH
jgi:hypothetical protein